MINFLIKNACMVVILIYQTKSLLLKLLLFHISKFFCHVDRSLNYDSAPSQIRLLFSA